ncbi:class I SAM-dependent methyltransferase [Azospirillum doebereinerae]|uniref:Class I SAM-dependent methyltransferase n=1 Tax=Azospirillum doebereinerae TaxID=92933 RepID=A0A3S0V5A0_9PROT|nr:class I SAM-dependent methyltransferase [Azospirillum doebereinerae]MCG5238938.1 class I SAM-dependent methyltransferase [Azospirillum doebereinerae]RUQ68811.1 class I SAM-dependent methyltransferase [Azospirillum doebereinerae]
MALPQDRPPTPATAPTLAALELAGYDEGWDSKWTDMRRHGPTGRHLRRIIARIIADLPAQTVLDVGCGEGSLIQALRAGKPAVYSGADFSESALRIARQRTPDAEFFRLDLTEGALDRRFDLVLCTDVVEHIEDDVTAIANLARMTGKHLLVATMQGRMRAYEKGVGHVRNYRYGELKAKVEATGLVVDRVVQWGFPFFSPLYRDLLTLTGARGTEGEYGPVRRLVAEALYTLFLSNRWDRGDYVFVLARRP